MNAWKRILVIACFQQAAGAQPPSTSWIEPLLQDESRLNKLGLTYQKDVISFYRWIDYASTWSESPELTRDFLSLVNKSEEFGLLRSDYQPHLFETFAFEAVLIDSADEIRLTDAAIHFLRDFTFGHRPAYLAYDGLAYSPGCLDIPLLLAGAVRNKQISILPQVLELKTIEYVSLKKIIRQYLTITRDSSFRETTLSSTAVNVSNSGLITKLWQLGILDSIPQKVSSEELKSNLKKAQVLFDLPSNGVLDKNTISALNVPLSSRLREANRSINTMRWLYCIGIAGKIIVVNIPSTELVLYEAFLPIIRSRIIVGKPATPTPTLSSRINQVILYPYWVVPHSIATKELLPAIKRNPNYLQQRNYQVINKLGKIIDPANINWRQLSAANFPYTIRQSTGCDNALGLVKLNFYNPFSVYLHDTPTKELFKRDRRFFSHGCMRVQKAMELARIILRNNTRVIDTLSEKGCLFHQKPLVIPASEAISVFVIYQTAWPDSTGSVRFYPDIYRKN